VSRYILDELQHEMRDCRRCLEAGYPIREGAIFSGSASARIMVVGQAPGIREGGTGLPFSGPAGKRLFSWLARAGFEEEAFRATQYITAIIKCFPGKGNSRGDRAGEPQIDHPGRSCGDRPFPGAREARYSHWRDLREGWPARPPSSSPLWRQFVVEPSGEQASPEGGVGTPAPDQTGDEVMSHSDELPADRNDRAQRARKSRT